MTRPALLLALALALTAPARAQIHVDHAAPPGGDGQSWATAFQSLDDALAIATPGRHVWVAVGTYVPTVEVTPGDPRSRSFAPGPGVRLFGGFDGTETFLADRAGLFRDTVLSGDLGQPGFPLDNARNVVRLEGNGAIHVVDGFRIADGYADGTGLTRGGGGIAMQLGTKTIRNCLIEDNRGKVGAGLLSQISITSIDRCTFRNNAAFERGGAVYATTTFSVTGCVFEGNKARFRGGAVHATQGTQDIEQVPVTRFQNCLFRDNIANNGGAAFVGDPSGPVAAGEVVWSNCTFTRNLSVIGAGAIGTNDPFSPGIVVDVRNSILWGNLSLAAIGELGGDPRHFRSVDHSIVEGGWPGAGNMDQDPLFVAPKRGDLRVMESSPAVDAGRNDGVLRDGNDLDGDADFVERTPFDITGAPRRRDAVRSADVGTGLAPLVDIGAYER